MEEQKDATAKSLALAEPKLNIKNQNLEQAKPSNPQIKEAKAYGRYLHIAPTKITDLMRLVRGKTVAEAETILKFSGRRGGEAALKVLRSAEANAGQGFEKDQWVVADARVNKGPLYRRRVQPRARGSADVLRSPSAHITIVIREQKTVVSKANEKMKKSSTERGNNGS